MALQEALTYLSLDDLKLAVTEWRKLHPRETVTSASLPTSERKAQMAEQGTAYANALKKVQSHFSVDALAELQTVYSIGRDRLSSDELRERVSLFQRDFKDASNLDSVIGYLFDKTNLQDGVCKGLVALGLNSWANDLRAL
ncbi:hypothetical protein [Tardiphaga sp.]|jgi:hypothetical protein|uniref:hypothetical protein n=1 Tax=Tardiphaga sp. TaxID=1926292 RepID=UPI0037DA65D5